MSSRNKSDVKKLFEFWCEVHLPNGSNQIGTIIEQFPESFHDKKTIADVPAFAFPCEFESDSVQAYSFVLTTDDSKWRYGFCRQDPKKRSAMVIITYLPWHDTFLKLLMVLSELRRCNNGSLGTFLTTAYNSGIPDPGGNLKLFYNGGQSNFVFERPLQFQLPSIPENHNLNLYYNFVDPKNMIAVFAAMLAERRIIFTSRRLDRLSSCIQAANAFLFPMVWQHIFIPVLPMKLKDYLSAPMPYLIGVPQVVLETMSSDELGEVVILNCDTKLCENPFDDVREMPPEIVSHMKKQLSHSQEHIGDRVSKIFLGVLVQLIGGYRDAVEFHKREKSFNSDKFIESRPSHLRPFLTKMMDLQIFQQFIDERLEMFNAGLGLSDEFELEIARNMEKMKRGRNYGFLKNVRDKTNPAVKSAVKSVKEGSRGVKTAYKDLKSKLRDITPPNNTNFRSHLTSSSPNDRIGSCNFGKSGSSHCSAPSSPVFGKGSLAKSSFQYASPEAINGAAHCIRRRNLLHVSNSNAHLHTSRYANTPLGTATSNSHLAASPTISPPNSPNSLCSSEMNLSQELENHPLFKLPIVDRSLKPNINFEIYSGFPATLSCGQIPARFFAPTMLPSSSNEASTFEQLQMPIPSYIEMKQPLLSRSLMPLQTIFQQKNKSTISAEPNQLLTTNSTFDNPPEMESPPIPPRHCYNNGAVTVNTEAHVEGMYGLPKNNWQNYVESSRSGKNALRCSTFSDASNSSASSDSNASFVTALSFSQQPLRTETPTPAPRLKKGKEKNNFEASSATRASSVLLVVPTPTKDNSTTDLISLDDTSNANFEVEDFDPLNQNARLIPANFTNRKKSTTLPIATPSSLISSCNISSLLQSNFNIKPEGNVCLTKPPPLPTSIPPPMLSQNEDIELLRKYGLDQFSLTTPSTSTRNGTTFTTTGINNWTTFD